MQIHHCNASAHSYTDKGHITDILGKTDFNREVQFEFGLN